ncbi:MAG: alpha/beta fold hydrolase [Pseudomonadota bacterium]
MHYETKKTTLSQYKIHTGQKFFNTPACYTLYGDLNNHKSLALFFHAFSTNTELHAWWKKFDILEILKNFNIICINSPGSSHGSFGPETIDESTGKPYHENFPELTIQDTVDFIVTALKKLKLTTLDLVFGCSLGGMQALDMYLRYPEMSKKFISVAGVPVPYMTKLTNLAQAGLIDQSINAWQGKELKTMLGLSRFFFRLSCTAESALEILHNKLSQENSNDNLKALEQFFVEDNLEFQHRFSAYSNSLLLKMIANFEINFDENSSKHNSNLLMVTMENDLFTPEKYVEKIFLTLKKKGHNCILRDFKTQYGHEAWILDGERFYEFIKIHLDEAAE